MKSHVQKQQSSLACSPAAYRDSGLAAKLVSVSLPSYSGSPAFQRGWAATISLHALIHVVFLQCVKRYRRAKTLFQHLLSEARTQNDKLILEKCKQCSPPPPSLSMKILKPTSKCTCSLDFRSPQVEIFNGSKILMQCVPGSPQPLPAI